MKKVYFQLGAMNVGGVEKAFLGLLSTLPQSEYEIHLGLLNPTGGYMSLIPTYVKLHTVDCYDSLNSLINDPPLKCIKDLLKKKCYNDALVHFILYVLFKMTNSRYWFYKYITRNIPVSHEQYDVGVAFAGPSQMIDFYVCEKIKAEKKIGWIHFDVTKFGIDVGMTRSLYKKYDKIFIVSKTAKDIFDDVFPEFKNKTEVRYNVVAEETVKEMANKGVSFNDQYMGIRILTVGRMSVEKGQDVTIDALDILIKEGYNVKWYYIGEGDMLESCKNKARKLGLIDFVCFLGLKMNPYPYMKDCDIYVQPSRHEGYCITIAEAKCFTSPIVSTCFTGASEQLGTFQKSLVVGMSAEDIANGVKRFL